MFTWICPKCGGEVPPAYDDCPRCFPKKSTQPSEPTTETVEIPPPAPREPAPPPPSVAPPPVTPPSIAAAPPPVAPPPPAAVVMDTPPPPRRAVVYGPPAAEKRGISPTIIGMLAGLGIAALLAVLYLFVIPKRSVETAGHPITLEQPGAAGAAARQHPLAKHLEVTGIRLREFKNGKATIQFVVVNHSAASLPEMGMDVTLRSADKTFFEIPAKLPSLGPFEVKDLSASVNTELKSYELPDWQMIRPQFTLRSE